MVRKLRQGKVCHLQAGDDPAPASWIKVCSNAHAPVEVGHVEDRMHLFPDLGSPFVSVKP